LKKKNAPEGAMEPAHVWASTRAAAAAAEAAAKQEENKVRLRRFTAGAGAREEGAPIGGSTRRTVHFSGQKIPARYSAPHA
jgi:hypothetical protein